MRRQDAGANWGKMTRGRLINDLPASYLVVCIAFLYWFGVISASSNITNAGKYRLIC